MNGDIREEENGGAPQYPWRWWWVEGGMALIYPADTILIGECYL